MNNTNVLSFLDSKESWLRTTVKQSCTIDYYGTNYQIFEFLLSLPILTLYAYSKGIASNKRLTNCHKIAVIALVMTETIHAVAHLLPLPYGEELIAFSISLSHTMSLTLFYRSSKGKWLRQLFNDNYSLYFSMWMIVVSLGLYLWKVYGYGASELLHHGVRIIIAITVLIVDKKGRKDAISEQYRPLIFYGAVSSLVGYTCIASEVIFCAELREIFGDLPFHCIVDFTCSFHCYFLVCFVLFCIAGFFLFCICFFHILIIICFFSELCLYFGL
eukprot:931722_1